MSESMEAMIQPNAAPKQTTCVDIPKSQATKLKVGQPITYTVTGKITGIQEGPNLGKPNSEDKYHVDVEISEIKGFENNSADEAFQSLRGEGS